MKPDDFDTDELRDEAEQYVDGPQLPAVVEMLRWAAWRIDYLEGLAECGRILARKVLEDAETP